MPPLLKNKYLLLTLFFPFLTALTVGSISIWLIGNQPVQILIVIIAIIFTTSVFTILIFFLNLNYSQKRTRELLSHIDRSVIPDQIIQSIAYPDDEVVAATQLINSLGKSYAQWAHTAMDSQNQLQAEKEKLTWIIKNITDPVITLDLQLNISLINPAAETILGLDPTLCLGQPVDQILKFQGRLGEIPLKKAIPIRQSGFEGILFTQNEVKIICLLNSKEAFANLTTIQIKHGSFINMAAILTFHDVTGEKQLEAMKLDFISMAAHELRTPLTSIKGYLSVFIQENEKILSPDQMMFIHRVSNSAQQLSALVENLLGVSRVERGAMTITTQPIDWVQTLQVAFEQFEHRAIEKRIELTFIKPTQIIPTIQADNVRINEVINNLLANAINYTEPGGKVTIWCELKDTQVITHIKDSGRGIPKESLTRLFTKFYRVPGNLDQASKGNGLGLYISKAIVELHKGRIWAESEGLGKGATFNFSLPVVETSGMDLNILTKKL